MMTSSACVDLDAFRLRRFVDHLEKLGEVETHPEPVALADISALIEASPKATLFTNAGPERFEIVGGVGGSRRRYAAAFGLADERTLAEEFARRMRSPQKAVEIPQGEAPVQQVVITGAAIDLTKLPFHMQHQYDGAPYISSAIDYAVDPVSGKRNVGCRRLMLRSRTTMRSNLTQMSDLKRMFMEAVGRGEHLTVNFAIGWPPACGCRRSTSSTWSAPCGGRRSPWRRQCRTAASFRPTPRWWSKAISTRPATPRSKGRTANSSATTGRRTSIRCSMSPPSPCARTRCIRPCCTVRAFSPAPSTRTNARS